jgi:hypothetical protein
MTRAIAYVNTDLELKSTDDLALLVAAFTAAKLFALHVTLGDDGVWFAVLETETQYDEPGANIAAMLAVIEALPDEARLAWAGCVLREFNIGYDCGTQPRGFTQALSSDLLRRVATLAASVRITIYPDREPAGQQA